MRRDALVIAAALLLVACATPEPPQAPEDRPTSAADGRALVRRLLPREVRDADGWATDIFAAVASLDLPASSSNVCAVIAVIEQESGFRADPAVPGLPAIAAAEIEKQRERLGVPRLVLDAALALEAPDGRSYRERLQRVRTERELSELYEDFIARVPLGATLLARRNPVRTGGAMQVSIAFAEAHVRDHPYPYPVETSVRREVFTRRGGVYFGTAHLLDYRAPYDRALYRFADFNAGRHASRNAAFQRAVTQLTGVPLTLDGDLLRYDGEDPRREPSSTELAVRALGGRLGLDETAVRRDLEQARGAAFERTPLYTRTMAMADRAAGGRAPRAVVPQIPLRSPKITRPLTTEWFAQRVDERYARCLARAAG